MYKQHLATIYKAEHTFITVKTINYVGTPKQHHTVIQLVYTVLNFSFFNI